MFVYSIALRKNTFIPHKHLLSLYTLLTISLSEIWHWYHWSDNFLLLKIIIKKNLQPFFYQGKWSFAFLYLVSDKENESLPNTSGEN